MNKVYKVQSINKDIDIPHTVTQEMYHVLLSSYVVVYIIRFCPVGGLYTHLQLFNFTYNNITKCVLNSKSNPLIQHEFMHHMK